MVVIPGSQPGDTDSSSVGGIGLYIISATVPNRQRGLFRKQIGWKRRVGSTPTCGVVKNGACPGGEEAVLKTVGQKWLAGSNPVRSAISCVGREVLHPLGKRRSAERQGWIDHRTDIKSAVLNMRHWRIAPSHSALTWWQNWQMHQPAKLVP